MDPHVEALDQLRRQPLTVALPVHEELLKFPLEALPPLLRRFVKEAAESLPVPVDLIAVPALVCASAAIGASRVIKLKADWIERAALYAAVVAAPGTLKSPALRIVTLPIRKRQITYRKQFRLATEAYEKQRAAYTCEMKKPRTDCQAERIAPPVQPAEARSWTADVTVEKLASLLAENPRGLLIIRDEFTALVNSMNQYKGGKGADRQFYLSAWSGEAVVVDRQGKDSIQIEHPFLSIIGCIPPDMVQILHDEQHREDGFLHRIILAYPEMAPVRWTNHIISDDMKHAYSDLFDRLYALRPLSEDPLTPVSLPLTADAQRLFITWHDEHCQETEDPDVEAGLRGVYAKLKGYCPRLALIHALCSDPDSQEVGIEAVAAACDLIEYFKAHANKALPLSTGPKRTLEKRCEDEIIRAHQGGRVLTKREAQRRSNFDAAIFNKIHAALVGVGHLCETKKGGAKGREQSAFKLAEEE